MFFVLVSISITILNIPVSCAHDYYQNSQNQYNPHFNHHNHSHNSYTAIETREIPSGLASEHYGHGWPSPEHHYKNHEHHHHHAAPAPVQMGWGWPQGNGGHQFSSYFDIALTALAFLSFGIFLLNLLLNALLFAGLVTATGTGTNTGVITTTGTVTGPTQTQTQTGTGTGTGTGVITTTSTSTAPITTTSTSTSTGPITVTGGRNFGKKGEEESRGRRRREAFELFLDPVTAMDGLALTVLKSIDAMIEKHECVNKAFCDGHRQAKIIGSGFQYIMPLVSMSTSYLQNGWHENLLDNLKAVLLGVGEANCQTHFPHC